MSSTSTVILGPPQRGPNYWFHDHEGVLATSKRYDDLIQVNIDFADLLASGETVSSVAYVDSGVTTSSKSLSSPIATFEVTGIGETELTATTSTSRILQRVVRFYALDGVLRRDYTG